MPVVFGMLVTRDDADVIVEVVEHALTFCERIYALDNMSADATWGLITELSNRYPGRIVQLRQFEERFYDGIRAEIHEAGHDDLADGWWLMLAPDEFCVEDPRPILASAEGAGDDAVIGWLAQFQFTDRDRAAFEAGQEDVNKSIRERRLRYRVDWREIRFFRNDPSKHWTDQSLYLPRPESTWHVHRKMVVMAHYQFRTPAQIQRRVELRHGLFPHVKSPEWTDYVKPWWKYPKWRGGTIRTTGVWYYARRIRQRVQVRLGRRPPPGGLTGAAKSAEPG